MALLMEQQMMMQHQNSLRRLGTVEEPLLGHLHRTVTAEGHDEEAHPEDVSLSLKTVSKTGLRREVWLFLHQEKSDTGFRRFARTYEFFSVGLVVYLVVSDIFLSIPDLSYLKDMPVVFGIELFIYVLFTTEYLLRLWSCMADAEYCKMGACKARRKVASEVMNVVDLMVCSAFFINFLPGFSQLQGMGALRMIRLLRVAALLKVERKTNSFGTIIKVFTTKRMELLSTVFMAGVLMVMSAAVMYYIETDTQPVVFGSIPMSLWWSVTALTTVGYGDVSPKTSGGQFVACIIAFFGVGIFALPAGILGEGFMEAMEANKDMDFYNEGIQKNMTAKLEKAAEVKKGIETLHKKVERVQKGQQQILMLLQALTPDLLQAPEEEMEITVDEPPSTSASAVRQKAYNETGLASHYASLGEEDLAAVQGRVDRKLRELELSFNSKAGYALRQNVNSPSSPRAP